MGALLARGYDLYQAGNVDTALIYYERAAEMGFELAQSNAAWLYDHEFGQGDPHLKRQKAFEYYRYPPPQKKKKQTMASPCTLLFERMWEDC